MTRLFSSVSLCAVTLALAAGSAAVSSQALANDKLVELAKSDDNWPMTGKNYDANNYSPQKQINKANVKQLRPAWSFSTGVLSGHEGTPLVVNNVMYIHSPYPNTTFAVGLDDPGHILWQHKPKQNPTARAVACCDVVNRGLAYWPGDGKTPALILKTQLDGHIVALNAETGAEFWKLENSDIKVGSTLTIAPYVVKDTVLVGSSGAELGVRGYVTAYDVKTGAQKWRAYATGPDEQVKLANDFNKANPQYGQKGLGTGTWEGDAWKIGGGTNWGWYAFDPGTNMIYYGSGNPAPWNETMRPGDNKWTMTIWGRDIDTGEAHFGYQKTPHDEWDYAGVNVMMLSEQKDKAGKMRKLLTHPDRNGIVYTLDRTDGSLVSADKIDDTVNWVKQVDLKTGLPQRDPEYATRMDHKGRDICPSAMGYHNQGHDSYDPERQSFFMGINHICMDWEPFMLPYRAGQFFVGATLWMYPGPKGNKQTYEGLGQVKAYDAINNKYKWEVMERFAAWGGTLATAGGVMFYGTLDGFIKARDSDTGELLWKFKLPSGVIGHPMTYTHKGVQYVAIYYGVGGWPGVGLVFDLNDPTAGLGSVGAFKQLQNYTQMGGGVMVFSLDGKGPYDDPKVGEYASGG
ncbi:MULTISPECIES: methanol/ethanol family PQQ-dependent dehydrogenase [Xanthobacter]|jgi:methanol dehydrogenase (cytochrome c) subunit 1|uniref:Methanol dehydrogenase n=1 Tax=Xanthobacter flavus TaxID=281 RepID=A0A9W6CPF8_XANFL|nr:MULTISPECIES: methanol/ethanol family PQQ-dependent dehydrogenase [Xanthobacter]MBN8916754.1 methanol/ethanol family PQQ-dependent dehydrogenase [Hyphomicrobiales bacterium]MDR6335346.1 methanol dehydrogenase (cytochrome c) subunit 1 [Xanthobacter flavus]NMN58671.1 methanol dehydrogenase (cytochrome c) subunit 1 [Xanthobacter sp. SG618]UDQ87974.1 methanol/ethanol family PQQ-dependent dehydrogenase [Xanthobacter autotrophicus]UJX46052.1 PQQ-dependent dehydrogenase, methanol/ethanol family [X